MTIPAGEVISGSAYSVRKIGRKWIIEALNDDARCLMLDVHTPGSFTRKKDAVDWIISPLMFHSEGRSPGIPWVAQDVYLRVKKATRSSSEKRHWVVTMRAGNHVKNKVFGALEKDTAKRYYEEHKA